jgi:hypothetical protein
MKIPAKLSPVLLTVFISSCANVGRERSICDIKAGVSGKVLRVQSVFVTDRLHGSYLEDAACPARTVHIGFPSDDADKSVRNLDNVVWKSPASGRIVRLKIDATGLVTANALLPASDFEIRLMSVHAVSVEPAPMPNKH